MLIKTLTRRVVPAAAVFAVLAGALVAQDRIASAVMSVPCRRIRPDASASR